MVSPFLGEGGINLSFGVGLGPWVPEVLTYVSVMA